jgi:sugar/nucleoside kinase (ribokinase family)
LREHGPALAVVTLGKDGCYFDSGSAAGTVRGPRVEVVDTLGAGDAFMAGLLAGFSSHPSDRALLCDEAELLPVLRFANAAGAITTTQFGAIPALPTRRQVEALMASSA